MVGRLTVLAKAFNIDEYYGKKDDILEWFHIQSLKQNLSDSSVKKLIPYIKIKFGFKARAIVKRAYLYLNNKMFSFIHGLRIASLLRRKVDNL